MEISPSSIADFMRCRRLYGYRGAYEPRTTKTEFVLGRIVHSALESWYTGAEADPLEQVDRLVAREMVALQYEPDYDPARLEEIHQLASAMVEGYMDQYQLEDPTGPDAEGVVMLAKEVSFKVPIPLTDGGVLKGRIDGLCYDRYGRYWIVETKTYKSEPNSHDLNLQTLAYVWALNTDTAEPLRERYGMPSGARIQGSLYNGLRKQLPGPRVTKPLFMRSWVGRNREELRIFGHETLPEIHDDMAVQPVRVYPNYMFLCDHCEFRAPCQAAQAGANEQYVLDSQYKRRSNREHRGEQEKGMVTN